MKRHRLGFKVTSILTSVSLLLMMLSMSIAGQTQEQQKTVFYATEIRDQIVRSPAIGTAWGQGVLGSLSYSSAWKPQFKQGTGAYTDMVYGIKENGNGYAFSENNSAGASMIFHWVSSRGGYASKLQAQGGQMALVFTAPYDGEYTLLPDSGTLQSTEGADASVCLFTVGSTFAVYRNNTLIWPESGVPYTAATEKETIELPNLTFSLNKQDVVYLAVTGTVSMLPVMNYSPNMKTRYYANEIRDRAVNTETVGTSWVPGTLGNIAYTGAWTPWYISGGSTYNLMDYGIKENNNCYLFPENNPSGAQMQFNWVAGSGNYAAKMMGNGGTVALIFTADRDGQYTLLPDEGNIRSMEWTDPDVCLFTAGSTFGIYQNDTLVWPSGGSRYTAAADRETFALPEVSFTLNAGDQVKLVITGTASMLPVMQYSPDVRTTYYATGINHTVTQSERIGTTWGQNVLGSVQYTGAWKPQYKAGSQPYADMNYAIKEGGNSYIFPGNNSSGDRIFFNYVGGNGNYAAKMIALQGAASLTFTAPKDGKYALLPDAGDIRSVEWPDPNVYLFTAGSTFGVYRNDTLIWPTNGTPYTAASAGETFALPALSFVLNKGDSVRLVATGTVSTLPAMKYVTEYYAMSIRDTLVNSSAIGTTWQQGALGSTTYSGMWEPEYGNGSNFSDMIYGIKEGSNAYAFPANNPTGDQMQFNWVSGNGLYTAKMIAGQGTMALTFTAPASGQYRLLPDYGSIQSMEWTDPAVWFFTAGSTLGIYKNDTLLWPENGTVYSAASNNVSLSFPSLTVWLEKGGKLRLAATGSVSLLPVMQYIPDTTPLSVDVWTADALSDIYPYSTKQAQSNESIHLDMARNEYESAQIALRSNKELKQVSITFDNISAGAPTLTARPIRYVPCTYSSSNGVYPGPSAYYRGASQTEPGLLPEYYENTNVVPVVEANTTQSFVLEAYASANTAAGTYTATAVIRSNSDQRRVPITVQVYPTTLPAAAESSFTYSNWTDSNAHPGMFQQWYGTPLYTETYWTVIANFAKAQKKQRQNSLWVPLMSLLKSDLSIATDGTYQFSFTNFDRYIETSLANGSYKYIEGSQLMGKDWDGNFSSQKEYGPGIVEIYQGSGTNVTTQHVLYSDPAAQQHLQQLLTQLSAHIIAKGWNTMWIQHGFDECFDVSSQMSQAASLLSLIKQKMPFAKTVDAGSVYSVLQGYDMPCPRIDFYEADKQLYDQLNSQTNVDLWVYADTGANGDILFRAQDYPLMSTRAIGWYCYANQASGYLHWAWNLWDWTGLNPFEEMSEINGPTDTYMVYPDTKNLSVMESTRSTAVRDGFEDYELLKLAYARNAQATQTILQQLVTDQHTFQRSPSAFMTLRTQLLALFS